MLFLLAQQMLRQQKLLLGLLLLSSALATPVLDRGDCPSLQQIGEALETVLGVQVKYIDIQT